MGSAELNPGIVPTTQQKNGFPIPAKWATRCPPSSPGAGIKLLPGGRWGLLGAGWTAVPLMGVSRSLVSPMVGRRGCPHMPLSKAMSTVPPPLGHPCQPGGLKDGSGINLQLLSVQTPSACLAFGAWLCMVQRQAGSCCSCP